MIEPATPEDFAAVLLLERDCLGVDAWTEQLVAGAVSGELPTVEVFVARDGDEVVGHAVASYAGDIAELQRIAVAPPSRRAGRARALLDEVLRCARRTGADRILLEVRPDNAGAIAFYAAAGFVEVDRRPRYYRDGSEAVVMRLSLGKGCGGQ